MDSPSTFLIFFTSPLPQNWAASYPCAADNPEYQQGKHKKDLIGQPHGRNGRCPQGADHQCVHKVHHCVQHALKRYRAGNHKGFS